MNTGLFFKSHFAVDSWRFFSTPTRINRYASPFLIFSLAPHGLNSFQGSLLEFQFSGSGFPADYACGRHTSLCGKLINGEAKFLTKAGH